MECSFCGFKLEPADNYECCGTGLGRWVDMQGKWTPEETEMLRRLVMEQQEELRQKYGPNANINDRIPWEKISEAIGTRTHEQCRHKWYRRLDPTSVSMQSSWTREDTVNLLSR